MKRKIRGWLKIFLISFGVLIGLSLILIIWALMSYSENTKFDFSVEETGEPINGEVIINNVSMGFTSKGKIEIPKTNLNVSEFLFKANYSGEEFNFYYQIENGDEEYDYLEFIVYENQLKLKEIEFLFYENNTNCRLSGEIYVSEKYLAKFENGIYKLNKQTYEKYFNETSELYITGLTDSCFGSNNNLPFVRYWIVYNLDENFETGQNVTFEEGFNPRKPENYATMQKFIRPYEVKEYFENNIKASLKNNTQEDLDIINSRFKMNYISDNNRFKEQEYWQTPSEVIKNKNGDCEDWAITSLSLINYYNSTIECYNAFWETHVSVFCYMDKKFIIYDQDKVKSATSLEEDNFYDQVIQQENKIAIRKMLNNYFDNYGLESDERRLYALFNEKELITFKNNEEFVEWATNKILQ
jgi:hypothetical protein